MNKNIIVNAEGAVLGRLASFVAKQALLGKSVDVVNTEKSLITGLRMTTLENYKQKRSLGGTIQRGPNFPSSADKILKRTIRGMLSYKQGRGADALKRIKTHNGVPKQFEAAEKISLAHKTKARTTTLGEIAREL
jgi:large subunit ribosomal protein L13